MPIETPSHSPIGRRPRSSEFFLCENFAFRPANVDGFSHQTFEDGAAITTVNFKGYTQSIPDSNRHLFQFLLSVLEPQSLDENP